MTKLTTCLEDVETVNRDGNIVTFTVPRFKQRITVVVPDFNSIQSVLDVCKVTTLLYSLPTSIPRPVSRCATASCS